MNKAIFFILMFFTQICAIASNLVNVEMSSRVKEVSAGQIFEIDFKFAIEKNIHIYSSTEKDFGQPTRIELELPNGYTLEKLTFPPVKKLKSFGIEMDGYEGVFIATATLRAPNDIKKSQNIEIKSFVSWLACSQQCVPEEIHLKSSIFENASKTKDLPALSATATPNPQTLSAPQQTDGTLGLSAILAILASAFLGGAILNLMPCVFPVIGLKIISFAESANQSRKSALAAAFFYTLGIVASFLALAILLLILRAVEQNLGWGFQLQNPIFTSLMALLFFGMALSFAGVFEIGAGFAGGSTSDVSKNQTQAKKYWAAAMSGVVAVLVASPCTAPFMGTAMGAALTTNASNMLCIWVFTAIGLGMAAPYIILSAIPQLARMMPRPGEWMDILKQLLSIPLFATVIWLVWVYTKQTDSLNYMLSSLLFLAIGARIYGMFYLPQFGKVTRFTAIATFIVLIGLSIFAASVGAEKSPQQSEKIQYEENDQNTWSVQKVEMLRSQGKIVYVDFTASWCLTCQYNKQILKSYDVQEAFKKNNVTVLIGDWTNKNPLITSELGKFGRAGVPLNIVYPADKNKPPIELPAILTSNAVIEAIDKSKQ